MAMKSKETRKPQRPNYRDMKATKAPIAMPATVRFTAMPPFPESRRLPV
jgi:hypothetical protein